MQNSARTLAFPLQEMSRHHRVFAIVLRSASAWKPRNFFPNDRRITWEGWASHGVVRPQDGVLPCQSPGVLWVVARGRVRLILARAII